MAEICLWNDIIIPGIGYGTHKINEESVIIDAIQQGYRLIDTASHYYNEEVVGNAIRNSGGIKREKLFVVTKLWYSDMGYENAHKAFQESLDRLQTDYIDLYLIHWPAAPDKYPDWKRTNAETWKAFEELYDSKKVRAIGLSNFMEKHLRELLKTSRIKPMVNQIENHPGFWQKEIIELCIKNEIQPMAWSPLGTGEVLINTTLRGIARKYGKTPAQICLRWNLQHGLLPVPKSSTIERMRENLDVFDFNIVEEDMLTIDEIPFCGGQGAIVK